MMSAFAQMITVLFVATTCAHALTDDVITKCIADAQAAKKRPSGIHCPNSLTDGPCTMLFPYNDQMTGNRNKDENNDYRVSSNCYDPQLATAAKQCEQTCNLCCENPKYNCSDEAASNVCEAVKNTNLCTTTVSSLLEGVLKCSRTCGLCDRLPPSVCPNKLDKGTCDALLTLNPTCNDTGLRENCAGSCGLMPPCPGDTTTTTPTTATTSVCRDNATNCASYRSQCSLNNQSGTHVRRVCPRTCSQC